MKVLKRLVRDIIEPTRNLGHVDEHGKEEEISDVSAPTTLTVEPVDSKGAAYDQKVESNIYMDLDATIATDPPEEEGQRGKAKRIGALCEDCTKNIDQRQY